MIWEPIGPDPNPRASTAVVVGRDYIWRHSPEWQECPSGMEPPIASSRAYYTQYCLFLEGK